MKDFYFIITRPDGSKRHVIVPAANIGEAHTIALDSLSAPNDNVVYAGDNPGAAQLVGFDFNDFSRVGGENPVDFPAPADDVLPEDLLSGLLADRGGRQTFFNRQVVDPALQFGGSSQLRSALGRGFNPLNVGFELTGLLGGQDETAPGFEESLPRFADFATGNQIPGVGDIRERLLDLIQRQSLGDAPGGLSLSAQNLLENSTRQGNFIRAATNTRSLPGFLRTAVADAITRRIQNAQIANPGGNILTDFVNQGFRLPSPGG